MSALEPSRRFEIFSLSTMTPDMGPSTWCDAAWLNDPRDFSSFNADFREFFGEHPPARALGARRMRVITMIFRENALIAAFGLVGGLIIAWMTSQVLSSFLYGTSPHDPWALVGSVGVLIVIANAASLVPAARAARIEPIAALRIE
jgi:hypothetical protein